MLPPLTATRNARAAFLQLPAHLRILSHHHSCRSFSATASRNVSVAEVVAAPPLAILNSLHAIGIPWYAVIPTTAILVRGVFGYYFSSAPKRKRDQINGHLLPLVSAATSLRAAQQHATSGQLPTKGQMGFIQGFKMHMTGRQFGAGLISASSFVNLGLLLATAEAVRMKCGHRQGLLSTLLSPIEWVVSKFAPDHVTPAGQLFENRAQEMAVRLERLREARLQQAQEQGVSPENADVSLQSLMSDNLFQSAQAPAPPLINVNSHYFDPTLQTEGFSWCTDLTVADPSAILPGLAFAIMLSNVLLNPLVIPRPIAWAQRMPWPISFLVTRYSNGQMLFAALSGFFGYVLLNVPAAIALYIFSSVTAGVVQKRWLDLTMPVRKPIMRCTRGTRLRSKKAWSTRQ